MAYFKINSDHLDLVLSGKNPFKNLSNLDSNSKVNQEENQKNQVDIQSPWSSLVRVAEWEEIIPSISDKNDKKGDLFNTNVLDKAFLKSCRILASSTGLDLIDVKRVVFSHWRRNDQAKRSVVTSVRFFRDFDDSIFTDCEKCGFVNDPTSKFCENKNCRIERTIL